MDIVRRREACTVQLVGDGDGFFGTRQAGKEVQAAIAYRGESVKEGDAVMR